MPGLSLHARGGPCVPCRRQTLQEVLSAPRFGRGVCRTRDRLPPCRPRQFFPGHEVCNRLANHGDAFATHAMAVAAVRQLSLGARTDAECCKQTLRPQSLAMRSAQMDDATSV